MPKKFNWNAQGTESAYIGDTPSAYSASGSVGANDLAHAKKQVTETLTRGGTRTVVALSVTPAE